jgi:AsmA family/AsmA-like C-terminal region
MNNALLYIGGLMVTALALLFGGPYFVDWNSYRGIFEEEASRVLGREVRVSGNVNLRLLPAPYVRFEKIRIADLGAHGGNSIFRADSFTMWLSVPPLLRGVLEANQVMLKRPVVQLAIDETGAGNWRTLAVTPGSMPFLPNDVALQSVDVFDGTVVVSRPDRSELVRLEGINGEFSAEALDGPYKFKGGVNWGGHGRSVRIATAQRSSNGDMRFKAAVDAHDTGNSYVLEGRLSDLAGSARIDAEVTAKVALVLGAVGAEEASAEEKAKDDVGLSLDGLQEKIGIGAGSDLPVKDEVTKRPRFTSGGGADRPRFDLKAKVTGDARRLKLDDITVSLDHGGPPQLITGTADVSWADKMRMDVALASRWLDLDRLTVSEDGGPVVPLAAARDLFDALAAALPAEADTNATLEFDQLNFGGEVVSNVRLAASRANGPLELKDVRASFPGGTRLELGGVLKPGGKVPDFDGMMSVTGQSLLRFLGWGLQDKTIGKDRVDGPFALEGRIALSGKSAALTEATADVVGVQLAGDVKLGLGARKKISMSLEGTKIDARQIRGGIVGFGFLKTLFADEKNGQAEVKKKPSPRRASFLELAAADVVLKLKVGEIVDGARVLRDVDVDISVNRGALSMPVLKFTTPEGLMVEAEGDVADVSANPKGAIRALVSASTATAANAFIRLLDLPPDQEETIGSHISALAPFRVAGSLKFRERTESAADLTLDGIVQGGRMRASLRMDGGRQEWRTSPVDVSATIDTSDTERLLAGLLARKGVFSSGRPAPTAGRVTVKAVGMPSTGLLSLLTVEAEGLILQYSGTLESPKTGDLNARGELRVSVAEARTALAAAGVRLPAGAAGVPIDGVVSFGLANDILKLQSESVRIGEAAVRGTVTFDKSTDRKVGVMGDLSVDEVSIARLLSPILGPAVQTGAIVEVPSPDRRGVSEAGRIAEVPAEGPPPPIWPEQSFDLSALNSVGGHLKIRFGELALEPGLSLSNAQLDASFSDVGIKVETLEGDALGGKLKGVLEFEKTPAGVSLAGSLKIDVASGSQAAGQSGDVAAFSVGYSGRALSPAALIADLTGEGEVALGDATLTGMSPSAVAAVAEDALAGNGPAGGSELLETLKGAVKQGEINLGKVTIPVVIKDGALRLKKIQIEQKEGRTTFVTAVELASMKIDSEWQIEPKVVRDASAPGEGVFLPPVKVVYVGKLNDFSSLEPIVTTGALERELTVRKMERDVDELERLRKLDAIRAREQQERRKALEAERARAAVPVPQPAVPPPAVAPPDGSDEFPEPGGASNSSAPAPGTQPPGPDGLVLQDGGVPPDGVATASGEIIDPVTGEVIPAEPESKARRRVRRKKPAKKWAPFQQLSPY